MANAVALPLDFHVPYTYIRFSFAHCIVFFVCVFVLVQAFFVPQYCSQHTLSHQPSEFKIRGNKVKLPKIRPLNTRQTQKKGKELSKKQTRRILLEVRRRNYCTHTHIHKKYTCNFMLVCPDQHEPMNDNQKSSLPQSSFIYFWIGL